MARGGPQLDLRRLLTFGGHVPPTVGTVLALSLLATVAGNVSPPVGRLFILYVPALDTSGWVAILEVWRLLTWVLFQGSLPGGLLTLVFAGFMFVWLGKQLTYAWSERRFAWRCLAITAGTGAGTLFLLTPFGWPGGYFDLWPLANALLVTWGLVFPTQRISWWGVVEMRGATVAKAVTLGTPAWALLVAAPSAGVLPGLMLYVPHMVAIAIAWAMVAGGPRRTWWRVKEWWLRRRLEAQRRKFKVVTGTGTGAGKPPRWMN